MTFEEDMQAAIAHLQICLKEYREGEFEMAEECLDTALGYANTASEYIEKLILDIHNQAQKDQ